ncbi:MAG: sugar kinase [Desulfofustis sp.]|jgi:2-dehydro-3-deoxygluconokinase
MKPVKIALIGECMIELQEISPGVTNQTFGGDTLNTAIYCARLARDLPLKIDYVTALGTDTFSERMIKFWEREGVGSSLVLRQPGETPGLYYIELEESGERIFHYWRSTAAAKKCFEYADSGQVLDALSGYDGIYLSGISLAIFTPESRKRLLDRLQEISGQGVSIYFDCNYRPHLWTSSKEAGELYRQLYRLSDIVFLTTEEADVLLNGAQGPGVHDTLRDLGCRESVLKDGDRPCTIFAGGELIEVPAERVAKVIDTTAAGDSFSAVYLVARKFGCAPEKAAQMAHQTAAYVVCHKGAVAPLEKMVITGKDIAKCSG